LPVPRRDLAATRERLRAWFAAKLPRAEQLSLSELRGPGGTGFSNDTLLFDLVWREDGRAGRRELVVRIEPGGVRVFPHYDLRQQFRVLRALAGTDVPVPEVLWYEDDPAVLGAPFYVMARVAGRIPSDTPPYHAEGWLAELATAERAHLWWSGIETLVRIHRLDWRRLGVVEDVRPGASPLRAQLEDYRKFLDWAAQGRPHPASEAGLDWLEARAPAASEPRALCWGDARLGNMIFRDGRCVAVLDWEMVTLGNPAQDLAWWLFFDDHHSAGCGLPRLAGLPSAAETVARYEELAGRPVEHLAYYDVFAAFRFSVIMIRVAAQLADAGLLPPDSDFGASNICTRMLEERLARAGA
jgi:aminoglycoside phosphotransferase (APT) family kinase protein